MSLNPSPFPYSLLTALVDPFTTNNQTVYGSSFPLVGESLGRVEVPVGRLRSEVVGFVGVLDSVLFGP